MATSTSIGPDGKQYTQAGYYKEGDLQSFLGKGYVGEPGRGSAEGTTKYMRIYNPTSGEYLRVQPGSGSTVATRAGGSSTLVSPSGTTAQFSEPTNSPQNLTHVPANAPVGTSVDAQGNIAQPVQTQTPGTTAGLYKVPTGSTGPTGQIFDVFMGNEHIKDPNDPRLKGVNIDHLSVGKAPTNFQSQFSPYEEGFNSALGAGAGVPDTAGGEAGLLASYLQDGGLDNGSSIVSSDPYLSGMIDNLREYMNPANQRESLTETYQNMLKDSGIEAIDTQLLDMKNVIEGTEDDLRTEITKAGGFATESQVMALANARNKQLIKNYNNLLETRNVKESYLQTAIGLEEADRQAADKRMDSIFNMNMQIAEYGQRMQQNAVQRMQWLQGEIGFDGIYESVAGDPNATAIIERTMGLPSGGLAAGARQAQIARASQQQKEALDLQLRQEQILTERAQRTKVYNDISSEKAYDPGEILAYAQQFATTGQIPSGMPKGSFGLVSQAAKILPKQQGQILSAATGVSPTGEAALQGGMGALYSAIELTNQLKALDEKRSKGVISGTLGKIFGSDDQQRYMDTRNQIVDLLARARSGAALTVEEERRYSSMLPGRFTEAFFLGSESKNRIDNFHNALTSDLKNKASAQGWVVNGVSVVNIGGQDYTIGSVVQNSEGQQGIILSDGSIYY